MCPNALTLSLESYDVRDQMHNRRSSYYGGEYNLALHMPKQSAQLTLMHRQRQWSIRIRTWSVPDVSVQRWLLRLWKSPHRWLLRQWYKPNGSSQSKPVLAAHGLQQPVVQPLEQCFRYAFAGRLQ